MAIREENYMQILDAGIKLCTQKNPDELFFDILKSGMDTTHCDAATLYLYENGMLTFKMMKTVSLGIEKGLDGEPITDMPPVPLSEANVCTYSAIHHEVVNIPDVRESTRFDFSGPAEYDKITGFVTQSVLVTPLINNTDELIGVLELINAMDDDGGVVPFADEYEIIIRSLGSMAAIELTNLTYTDEIKTQMYSFVEALTTALDERTPYNALHTRNVEQYVGLLADHISKLHDEGLCPDDITDDRKEALRLAALLHDIGKMVVPLEVMNKSTRLGDDLPGLVTRFELLEQMYEIDYLRGDITEEEYDHHIQDLKMELGFIRRVNDISYMNQDDLSHARLLFKKKHVSADGSVFPYLTAYEIECLKIRKGTLTAAERVIMESHVTATARIVSKVHFGKQFEDVPRWVADHHEHLDGTGYPGHKSGDDLDLETRILTVADVYDALTATDRPYKKPMPQEEAITVLRDMADKGKVELRLVDYLDEALNEREEQ